MNFEKVGAYLRQPTSLFALADILGTLVALWFGVLPEGVACALLTAALPLLASDNSALVGRILAQRNDMAAAVHAVATHKDIGPAAVKIIADAVPAGALLAGAAAASVQAEPSTAARASGVAPVAALVIGLSVMSLTACGSSADQVVQRQQAVFALDLSYAAAAQVAAAYERNPVADPAVTAKMKPAFQTAHDQIGPLVDAARAGDPLDQAAIEAAQDALQAARALLPAS
ncbi:hypothetical protein J2D73_17300 [Acetobacter sacchari]|uniref:Uncharacterized protein n=1 Tax=Acetobacter sacchari TaxID=2661687 RepID=A0ABS3M027_9PROT|nr:hypothetical protein [Acetobacter sacchari]MBO1361545.1 hypothetical protein [Acetobacter sacchari]